MAVADSAVPAQAPKDERGPVLEVKNLEVVYNRAVTAIQGVSLNVKDRSITTIVGRNGAGKTTTLHAIAGFLPADDVDIPVGDVLMNGKSLVGKPPHVVARAGIGLVPERVKIFSRMTVEENLNASFASATHGREHLMSVSGVYEVFPVLKERRRLISGYLSGGERQMLAIGMGLLGTPELLMIDELSLGLSPALWKQIANVVVELRNSYELSFLVVEQNALLAVEIADYVYVMENGRVVFEGDTETIVAHKDFREFYLGIGSGAETKTYRDVKDYRRKRRWF